MCGGGGGGGQKGYGAGEIVRLNVCVFPSRATRGREMSVFEAQDLGAHVVFVWITKSAMSCQRGAVYLTLDSLLFLPKRWSGRRVDLLHCTVLYCCNERILLHCCWVRLGGLRVNAADAGVHWFVCERRCDASGKLKAA